MASRRMISIEMVSSDAFMDMPPTAQCLYFHLCMRADDDGFVDSANKVTRECQASKDDLQLLLEKRYLLGFPSGVVLIKHWFIHNTIPKDRYHETRYLEEKSLVKLKDNKSFTECNRNIDKMETKIRLDKTKEDKNKKTMCKADADALFENLWNMYPSKRGKGQISDAKKRHLLDIGIDEMTRAIERYKADLAENTWKKPQNGSTFFSSGYVDFLDENYESKEMQNVEQQIDDEWQRA